MLSGNDNRRTLPADVEATWSQDDETERITADIAGQEAAEREQAAGMADAN
jgi:hypothetical protein